MKLFLGHILKFFAIALAILLLCESMYFYSGHYQEKVNGWEVYAAIRKSKQNSNVKRLLLGDSVAMQIYPCDKEYNDMVSLACNQAITMAGYYFLLDNYIESNNNTLPENVILFINPLTLGSNMDQFAYHYFLKPFNKSEYQEKFTNYLINRISLIKYYKTATMPFFRTSNYSPEYTLPSDSYALVSPISRDYINKIQYLCKKNGISLQLLFTPSKESNRIKIESALEDAIEQEEGIRELLEKGKNSLCFLPDNQFKDNVHFEDKYIPKDYIKL